MSRTVISVENLSKKYHIGSNSADLLREHITNTLRRIVGRAPTSDEAKTIWALKDINLEVQEGEILGVIGHNGAGKSTLLKILSRITYPTTGRIEMTGRISSLLEVGTGFHPELTGRENVYMNAAILGMKRSETRQKFDEIVDFAGVERFIDTPVKRYSTGMRTRLAFSVAAHLEPEILIVDEVLSVGDMAFQNKSLGKMNEVSQQGRTVLFVSHNMGALGALCTRAVLLESGRSIQDGAPADVISQYLQTGVSVVGERWWHPQDLPENGKARLRAVRIISDDMVTSEVNIAKPISIEVDYETLTEQEHIAVLVRLFDNQGIKLLESANLPSMNLIEDQWTGRPMPRDFYSTRCTLPPDFLNDITYSVEVMLLDSTLQVIQQVNSAIAFSGYDAGEMRQELFRNKWGGLVRPRLAWQTEQTAGVPARK